MKKIVLTCAFALVLVFAFAALAGAKYAGYFLDGSSPSAGVSSKTPGYLSWGGAQSIMTANNVDASLQGSAHGGYVTTTTKCAVCHSSHRATSTVAAGAVKNNFLTNGDDACVQCHTAWGSSKASLLVEWTNPEDGAAGPHTHVGSCSACHSGGIHGGGSSQYWGMNAFMLGDASDEMIAAELPTQILRSSEAANGTGKAGRALVSDGTAGDSTDWFVNGGTYTSSIGSLPDGMTRSADIGNFGAAKSLLTGYTCGRCHTNSVFGNLVWGASYSRAATSTAMMDMTGHNTAPGADNATGTGSHRGRSGCRENRKGFPMSRIRHEAGYRYAPAAPEPAYSFFFSWYYPPYSCRLLSAICLIASSILPSSSSVFRSTSNFSDSSVVYV